MEMVDDAHPELAWKSLASGSRILKLIKGSGLWLNLCLSDFQIVSTLSSTINSKVYHATYKGEHVAIKEVGVEDEKQKKRFQREIQIMASCSHPNIIKIKGVFFEGPFAYVLLPFYQKGSVKSLINQGEVFSWLTIQDMFRQVISGVAYLHERGIVHADLKPSNILISSTGQPVIADFGIAKERGVFGELADITVTQTNTGGAAAGTALYMAPEQFLSTPLTPGEHRSTPTATCASDIWALGITLYEWAANNAYALGNKSGPVPTIPTLMPEAPGIPVDPKTVGGDAKLADAIASALVRDPSKRPIAYALLAHPYFSSSLHTAEVSNYTSTLAQSDERLEAVRSFIHAMRRANDAKVLVSVSRNRMVDSLSQIFSNLTEDEVVRPIMAVFQGEAGIDEGALTTEMLNLFYEQLVSEKKALVTGTTAESEVHPAGIVNGATYLPAVDNSLIPREVFELTGKLLLKNILENRAIPLQLNGTVLKYFCDIQPSILDLEEFDSQLGDTFKRLRVLSSEDLAAADLDFSIFSSEFLSRMMEGKYTTHCTVTSENVKDYIDLRVQFDLVECRKSALEAMKKGFFSISALSNHLKLLTPSDLSLLLCGMQHVPPELIISALEFQGFDSSSKTPQHLKEVLKEMNQNNLRRFLQLCTSSAALPANNTMKKIRVLKGADLNRLPVGHGCTNQLDLPDYNDKEVLQAKLSISLAHVSDGFHIV
ncbi:MAP kinase kinase-like protein [Angomonas deanei]|nr:MAP kinase kinase-like protein [Angomonas deanei]|eukprot:EPY40040.1 MAP kinase kinase-like protein [Angomonas deanei]